MIGGTDIIFPTRWGGSTLDRCARILRIRWPDAVFENANTGERWADYKMVPFDQIEELFIYRNQNTLDKWDEVGLCPDLKDTLIYLIHRGSELTAVVDEEPASETLRAVEQLRRAIMQVDPGREVSPVAA